MTTYTRTILAPRIVMAISAATIAATLTACGDALPAPSGSSVSPSPSPSASVPTAVGRLTVTITLTTPQAVQPPGPLTYVLMIHDTGGEVFTRVPVQPDGTFTITDRPPGTYEAAFLMLEPADRTVEAVSLPLTASMSLTVRVPATGCVYGGEVTVSYGRLPAGTQAQQQALVEQANPNNLETIGYVYRPEGGFVLAGATVSLPAPAQRPAQAQGCVAEEFTWVRT